MKIVVTGSLGNISKPLTKELVAKGHSVTVISSKEERKPAIEALGAKAAIGSVDDVPFLVETFKGADIVYLMEPPIDFFDPDADTETHWTNIARSYAEAIPQSDVTKVIHLSSVGAHTDKENDSFAIHYREESILRALPESTSIKFMRPVGFYTNTYGYIAGIKSQDAIFGVYDGDKKFPWVSPVDIAAAIAEEVELPFSGRIVRYIASEELSSNEIAHILGEAIGKPDLKWVVISEQQLVDGMVQAGMNPDQAKSFAEMQVYMGSGRLYEDYYRHQPQLGNVKFKEFAKEFASVYNKQ